MSRTTVRVGFYATILLLLVFAMPAMAEQASITVKPGPLQEALDAYSKATSTKLVYLNELVEGKNSPGARNASPDDALQKILQGTGLTFQMADNDTAVLKKKEPVEKQQNINTEKPEIPQDRTLTSMEEMTVTANKAEENIQDVPMSITAFGELMLEDKNIDTVRDLTDYVPNLVLTDQGLSSNARPVMRGISSAVGSGGVSTAMFIDGIPVLGSSGYDANLQDIERVEVLRGPQGTLYGKNAEAGVINIVTRQPDNTYRGKISVDGGEDYKKEVCLNVSGPIIQDKLFFGLSGQYYDKEGFIENGYKGDTEDDKEHWYGKGQLRWTPTDNLDINFIFSQLEYDNDGSSIGLGEIGAAAFGVAASGDREVYSDFDSYDESNGNEQALKVSYDFNDTLNVTSTTTHRFYNLNYGIDYDFSPIEIYHAETDTESDTISQELRLISNTEKMNWVAGIYYEDNDSKNNRSNNDSGSETYALFGQLRYALTPKLGMTGGLRYESTEKDMQDSSTDNYFENSWEDISPKFSLDYAITEQVMGYATVAKGFRSGGFNSIGYGSENENYDSEKLWSYEIGAKSQLLENRLIVNGALFYMDIDDMHMKGNLDLANRYITNAGSVDSYGAELEVQAKITPQFTMKGNMGYTNVEFDQYQNTLGDYSGNKVPNIPEYTFGIGGQYRADNGFYAGVDLVGVGKMYLEETNTYERDSFQLIHAKVGYEADNWDIYLYGKNILDEEYNTEYYGPSGYFILYSQPREIGVKLTYRF